MSTDSEGTLQIKNFKGVDRFTEGAESRPDVFESLQNWYIKNPGEMTSISGVTKLNAINLPNVSEIVHIKALETEDEKRLIVFYKPDTSAVPATPSDCVVTALGGTTVSRDVLVECCTGGGGRSSRAYLAQTIDSNVGATMTTGTDPGLRVRCMNFYVKSSSGTYIWTASAFRKPNGLFPAKVVIFPPGADQTAGTILSSLLPGRFSASASYDAAASLPDNRIYHFGISPWIYSNILTNINYADQNTPTIGFSCFVPTGKNKITGTFYYLPFNILDSVSAEVAMSRVVVYAGVTPNDMMPIADFTQSDILAEGDGIASTITKTAVTLTAFDVDLATDTFTCLVSQEVPNGTILKFTAGTATGLTANTYYYVVNATYDGVTTVKFQLSATYGGAAIDITAKSGLNTIQFKFAQVSFTMGFLPRQMTLAPQENETGLGGSSKNVQYPKANASPGRTLGIADLTVPNASPIAPSFLGCFSVSSKNISSATMLENFIPNFTYTHDITYQANRFLTGISPATLQNFGSAMQLALASKIQSRQYGDRLVCANGYNFQFYSNGYMCRPCLTTYAASPVPGPIGKFIEIYKDKAIIASSESNNWYQEGFVYYSADGDIFDFNDLTRVLKVNTSDQSQIAGLALYSQDLSTTGGQTYLVVGKLQSVFTWNGDVSAAPVQIQKAAGFVSPDCMVNTTLGPIFVSYDNVFLFTSSQNIIPVGDAIKPILSSLTPTQLGLISVGYHKEHVKIGYPSDASLDSEIWLKLIYENGGVNRYWTGPHLMKKYTNACVAHQFDGAAQVRFSFDGADVFERDDPGSTSNDGEMIHRLIRSDNQGLGVDHFAKLITKIYMHLRLTQDEDFFITLVGEDASGNLVLQTTAQNTGNNRQLKQIQIPQRYLARILSITIENTSNGDMSLYDLSILFHQIRRRKLR